MVIKDGRFSHEVTVSCIMFGSTETIILPYFAAYYAHSCITSTQFLGVKSGEKKLVPIHNTRQILTTNHGSIKLSIFSSECQFSQI